MTNNAFFLILAEKQETKSRMSLWPRGNWPGKGNFLKAMLHFMDQWLVNKTNRCIGSKRVDANKHNTKTMDLIN